MLKEGYRLNTDMVDTDWEPGAFGWAQISIIPKEEKGKRITQTEA